MATRRPGRRALRSQVNFVASRLRIHERDTIVEDPSFYSFMLSQGQSWLLHRCHQNVTGIASPFPRVSTLRARPWICEWEFSHSMKIHSIAASRRHYVGLYDTGDFLAAERASGARVIECAAFESQYFASVSTFEIHVASTDPSTSVAAFDLPALTGFASSLVTIQSSLSAIDAFAGGPECSPAQYPMECDVSFNGVDEEVDSFDFGAHLSLSKGLISDLVGRIDDLILELEVPPLIGLDKCILEAQRSRCFMAINLKVDQARTCIHIDLGGGSGMGLPTTNPDATVVVSMAVLCNIATCSNSALAGMVRDGRIVIQGLRSLVYSCWYTLLEVADDVFWSIVYEYPWVVFDDS